VTGVAVDSCKCRNGKAAGTSAAVSFFFPVNKAAPSTFVAEKGKIFVLGRTWGAMLWSGFARWPCPGRTKAVEGETQFLQGCILIGWAFFFEEVMGGRGRIGSKKVHAEPGMATKSGVSCYVHRASHGAMLLEGKKHTLIQRS
jgi:hypothetical protein